MRNNYNTINQIVINMTIEYYVGDSKTEELLTRLDNNGIKQGVEIDAECEDTGAN